MARIADHDSHRTDDAPAITPARPPSVTPKPPPPDLPLVAWNAVHIRLVQPNDTDEVADVYLSAIGGMTYLPQLYTEDETRKFIRDVMLPNNEVWVAEEAEKLVGFVGFGDGSLRHLWVRTDNQNQGVGTALLNVAKERCLDGLKLRVFQKNLGARRLYERHGFSLVELIDGDHNEEHEPEACYVWWPARGS
jgi:ribosomal protein S18 acetylase RimI-like enzyme